MKRQPSIDCATVKNRIALGERLNAEEGLHLLDCPECQAFADAQQLLLQEAPAPSANLDQRVKEAFKAAHHHRATLGLWKRILPAAAAAIVLAGALAFALAGKEKPADESQLAASVTRQNILDPENAMPAWELEFAMTDNELDRLEMDIYELALNDNTAHTPDADIEGVFELDYEIISLEMDMLYDL